MSKLGTKSEYAEHYGCKKSYLSKAGVKERLEKAMVLDGDTGKWLVDFDKADQILKETSDPARHKKTEVPTTITSGDEGAPGFHDFKTQREEIKLNTDRLELEKALGNTLDRQKTIDACTWWAKSVLDLMKSRNRRMGDELSTLTDPREIKAALDKSDQEVFRSLSDDFRRKLSLPDPTPDKAN